jgi:hypothetical protein
MTMQKKHLLLVMIGLLILAAGVMMVGTTAVSAGSSTHYSINPQAITSGGETVAAGPYTIQASAGQPLIGESGSASYTICSGFWCQIRAALSKLFLPLVTR